MMLLSIKKIVKQTPLFKIVKIKQLRRKYNKWSFDDQKMLEFYRQFISNGDLCFDVGANVGNRTKILLKLGAKVIAVEPQIDCAQIIQRAYGNKRKLQVVQKALGEKDGEARIMISNQNVLSSLSNEWIQAVSVSGRFSKFKWEETQNVQITTLDRLIEQYGVPDFIKIDVEGFEYPVIKGLSQPVNILSLEFTPEIIDPTIKCIRHLHQLGDLQFNYSIGESMEFALDQWVSKRSIIKILDGYRDNHILFGDLYVRFL